MIVSEAAFLKQASGLALRRQILGGLKQVEKRLAEMLHHEHQPLEEAVAYLQRAGGKRVRPLLVLLVSLLGRGIDDRVVSGGALIELVHLGSLYHDDVMDDADFRRGRPAAQRLWGNSAAILAGDLLFARANLLSLSLGDEVQRVQVETFQRLVTGQMRETLGIWDSVDPQAAYLQVLRDKTSSLLVAALETGAILGGVDQELRPHLAEFGECVGVVFQLVDDVIDISECSEPSGKTPGTDLKSGVATLPLLLLRQAAEESADDARLLAEVEAVIAAPDPEALSLALARLREHRVVEESLKEAGRWAERAQNALERIPSSDVRQALSLFVDFSLGRRA